MTTGLVTTQQIDISAIMNLMLIMVMMILGRA